jgi:hypothetical protein
MVSKDALRPFLRSLPSAFRRVCGADPIFRLIRLVPRWDRTSTYAMKQQQGGPYLRFKQQQQGSGSNMRFGSSSKRLVKLFLFFLQNFA